MKSMRGDQFTTVRTVDVMSRAIKSCQRKKKAEVSKPMATLLSPRHLHNRPLVQEDIVGARDSILLRAKKHLNKKRNVLKDQT